MSKKRILTPLEKNFLKKHNFDVTQNIEPDIPVEYLVNKATFRDQDFYVDNNTLIPRLETEILVEHALANILNLYNKKESLNILDLCTGSGCVGISIGLELQKKNKSYNLYLSDISDKALVVAKKNVETFLPNKSNTHVIQSDLFENIPKINFDIIISNPPYIPTKNISNLDKSVKDFEPILALDGGDDGAEIINKIVQELPKYQKNINTIIEIDDTHSLNTIKNEGFKPSLLKDQFGIDRFISFSS